MYLIWLECSEYLDQFNFTRCACWTNEVERRQGVSVILYEMGLSCTMESCVGFQKRCTCVVHTGKTGNALLWSSIDSYFFSKQLMRREKKRKHGNPRCSVIWDSTTNEDPEKLSLWTSYIYILVTILVYAERYWNQNHLGHTRSEISVRLGRGVEASLLHQKSNKVWHGICAI